MTMDDNNNYNCQSLYAAVRKGELAQVRLWLGKHSEHLHVMTPFGTLLHIAAKAGNLELVIVLISMGADLNVRGGTFGGAPVNHAAGYGHSHVVRALVEAGAELDVSEPERNPLFSAIQGGHIEIVKILVECGIDYNVRYTGESMKQMDATDFARERGKIEIAQYIADLMNPNINNRTC